LVAAALAVVAAAPFFLLGLGAAPFDDPGEGMHAEIARELLRSGPTLPLTLNGVPYLDKPPLLYALLAGAFSVAGPCEAPARAVSAAAALVTIAATAWLGARLLGGRSGLVAGLALSTSLGFFVYGRYVRPETLLLATLAVGFALALSGLVESSRWRVIAGLAVFGLAALAKDPLAALGPPLAIGLALALGGRARPLDRWLPWPGVILGLVLAFGWWAMAEYSTRGFAWYTVVDNHILNVARARHFPDEDIPLGAGEFLAVAALGIVPWIVPAMASIVRLARRRAWREPEELPWVALVLWAAGVLGLTALSPFRLPHYGLPAYPALALLAARGWNEVGSRSLALLHAALFGALAVAATLAWTTDGSAFMTSVLGATDVATRKMSALGAPPPLPPWSAFRPLVGAAALTLAAGAVALAVTAAIGARMVAPYATVATLLLLLPSAASALGLVAAHRSVKPIAELIARHAGPPDIVVHEGPIENSGALEWYSGRRPVIVDGRRSVLGFGATRPEAAATFWDAARLELAWRGSRRVWAVTGRPPEQSLVAPLPGARLVAATGGRSLYVNR
jgi:4-amino-4-deoxy-L-arabinose transferase-like glycosyltransferase